MLHLRNEFIFAPVKLGYSDGTGIVNERHLNFYNQRSKHVGAVTPEPFYIHKGLRELPTQLGIDSDDKIAGLENLTAIIHQNGAKAIAHLNHPGRMANPKISGNFFVSSSAVVCENGGQTPKAMDENDMSKAIDLLVSAAQRAEKAGFDIIELQAGHGYLAAQFLSPSVNQRSDSYGVDFEGRVKFPMQMIEAVQKAINLPLIIRISGDEMIPNGFHLPEMLQFSQILKDLNVAAIHVTAGSVCSTPPWFFQHMFVPKGKTWEMAAAIKRAVDIPIIAVGKIHSAADIETIKSGDKADYIALGRALIADPDIIGKYLGQVQGQILPCLACSEGCLGGVKSGQGLGCVVNPLMGVEKINCKDASVSKAIAIVGGGLAGMEAAITLKKRGHSSVIFEKEKLGGQFNLAWLPPGKSSLKELVDYYEEEIEYWNIPVEYKAFTVEDAQGFDEVIVATGAEPIAPKIEGLKKYYWTEFLHDNQLPENERVMIVGGGLIGLEVASKLVEKNNEVIIVEMLNEVARGMEMLEKKLTMAKLKKFGARIYTGRKVVKVEDDKVTLHADEDMIIDKVDKIVMATGMKSVNALYNELKDKAICHVVGDAQKVGKAIDAIHEAYLLACKI